eukprot:RCo021034
MQGGKAPGVRFDSSHGASQEENSEEASSPLSDAGKAEPASMKRLHQLMGLPAESARGEADSSVSDKPLTEMNGQELKQLGQMVSKSQKDDSRLAKPFSSNLASISQLGEPSKLVRRYTNVTEADFKDKAFDMKVDVERDVYRMLTTDDDVRMRQQRVRWWEREMELEIRSEEEELEGLLKYLNSIKGAGRAWKMVAHNQDLVPQPLQSPDAARPTAGPSTTVQVPVMEIGSPLAASAASGFPGSVS